MRIRACIATALYRFVEGAVWPLLYIVEVPFLRRLPDKVKLLMITPLLIPAAVILQLLHTLAAYVDPDNSGVENEEVDG